MSAGPAESPHPDDLSGRLYQALVASDRVAVGAVLEDALAALPPLACAERVLGPALNRIGDAWSTGEVSLAQLYLCGRICEQQLDHLLPEPVRTRPDAPRLGIATLTDHHVLGKRIVASFLRIAGYPLCDYGAGIGPRQLAARVREDDLDALLVSTLMLPSALKIEHLTALLLDHPVKIFVGGAPFSFDRDLWRLVGADGMGTDAADALALVADLPGRSS
jgi:methanogenic corrinoid protein MtbC1